jgi:hypothetical protein
MIRTTAKRPGVDHPIHLHVTYLRPEHTAALAAMQRLVYPTLTDDELFTQPKYMKHLELFPEGQLVALAEVDGRSIPIGIASSRRTHFDFKHYDHTYLEAIDNG